MLLPLLKRSGPYALLALLCAMLAWQATEIGDWHADAGTGVEALAAGDVGRYLSWASLVGPFASAIQAPFVAVSGASGADAYPWAVFPCLFGAALAGLYLGRIAVRRGAPPLTGALIPLLLLLNPLTIEALDFGHPEEILTAALAVAAIAAAAENHPRRAAVLLGLAIASKQWAVIAILPVLLVLPARKLKVGAGAAAVAAVLFLPSLVASPESFRDVQQAASGTPEVATPWSVWYPLASDREEVYLVGGKELVSHADSPPPLVAPLSHPLIVVLAIVLPLALAWRRGLRLSAAEGFALFALVALLRCVLDPVDNLYYHAPLLMAVIGWDAFRTRGLPLRSLAAVGVAVLFAQAWHDLSDPATFNAAYLGFASVLGLGLISSLFSRSPGRAFQPLHFSPDVTRISGIKKLKSRSM
jgi:glycosyl transferase family 87